MSDYTVKLPDVGEGVAEAEIVDWHVAIGDVIDEDDVLVEVMSDKATIELPSPVAGTVTWVAGDVGDVLAVGSAIVRIDVGDGAAADGGDEQRAESAPVDEPSQPAPPEASRPASPGTGAAQSPTRTPVGERPSAAPAVRARARDLGIDLGELAGSGPDGRITHADLDALLVRRAPSGDDRPTTIVRGTPPPAADTTAGGDAIDEVRITGLRRNIAERMQASKRRIPHFTYVEEVDVTDLERLRATMNDRRTEHQPKLSLLPFLMRAVVVAVRTHPEMNARFDDEAGVVRRHRAVHLGIAAQTDRGLMVPVVHDAGRLDAWESAREVARLADAARAAKISLAELSGSTITITSLGALGGVVTTPVINSPEVAIVGVNKIVERPVYLGDALVRRQMMNLSSSFDHRVIDGADAAAFVQTLARLLEHPALLFVDGA